MSTITAPRAHHRTPWTAEFGIAESFSRSQQRQAAISEASSIQERINVASRRCEALSRQLLADGAQWLPNREALRSELSRLEGEIGTLYAQKRAALAGMEVNR